MKWHKTPNKTNGMKQNADENKTERANEKKKNTNIVNNMNDWMKNNLHWRFNCYWFFGLDLATNILCTYNICITHIFACICNTYAPRFRGDQHTTTQQHMDKPSLKIFECNPQKTIMMQIFQNAWKAKNKTKSNSVLFCFCFSFFAPLATLSSREQIRREKQCLLLDI